MRSLRILVIEDNAFIGMFLGEVLKGLGHIVCAIEATEACAVTAAALYEPDFMIVDSRLGDGSGLNAVEQIHLTRFIPHVFITGDPSVSAIRAFEPDAVILQKPFHEKELQAAIQRVFAEDRSF